MKSILFIFQCLLTLMLCATAQAALPPYNFNDWELVNTSDVIVVAQVKPGTVKESGEYGEHSLKLNVTKVLKGQITGNELTIQAGGVIVPKPGQDNVWMLSSVKYGDADSQLRIDDLHFIQPVELKNYFIILLNGPTEFSLRNYLDPSSPICDRALLALQQLQFEQIVNLPDSDARTDKLLALFLAVHGSNLKIRIQIELEQVGDGASHRLVAKYGANWRQVLPLQGNKPYNEDASSLVPLFKDPGADEMKEAIIVAWIGMDYRDAGALLIDQLKQENDYWGSISDLPANWWKDTNDPWYEERKASFSRTETILKALAQFKTSAAKSVIMATKKCWQKPNCDQNKQIETACDTALKRLME